jgi:hypothetical protein
LEQFSKRSAVIDAAMQTKVGEFEDRQHGREPSRFEWAALQREAAVDTRAKKTHSARVRLRPAARQAFPATNWDRHPST